MNHGLLLFLAIALLGLGCMVAGVYILLGLGYSLLSAGAALLLAAGFVRKGLVPVRSGGAS